MSAPADERPTFLAPDTPRLAVVVPLYNEVDVVGAFVSTLLAVLDELPVRPTVILVDDGSTDGTGTVIDQLQAAHADVLTVLRLARNFGHQYGVDMMMEAGGARCTKRVQEAGLPILAMTRQACVLGHATASPRYTLLDEAAAASSEEAMLQAVVDHPGGPVPVVVSPDVLADYLAGPASGQVRVEAYEPGNVRLLVESPRPRLLLVRESWVPGWEAWVDDRAVSTYRAGGLFFSVPVPAGTHRVEVRYRAPGVRLGLAIAVGWLVAAALSTLTRAAGGVTSARARSRRPTAST